MMDAINSAVSALNAAQTVGAVTANNIANVNTQGFKSKLASLSEMASSGVKVSSIRLNNGLGSLIPTGNPQDVVLISNQGGAQSGYYFNLTGSQFRIDDMGNMRSPMGDILFAGIGNDIRIDENGSIYQNDNLIGQITPNGGQTNFQGGESILSGYMLTSNTDILTETVNSLVNLRFFEANLATVRAADEMLGTLINIKS